MDSPTGSTAAGNSTAYRAVNFRHSRDFVGLLQQLGASLLISTYQAGKLVAVGAADAKLNISLHNFDQAMGLAVHSALPAGTGYTTLEFKISFIKGMTQDTGPVRTEGKTLSVGRRAATAEARITDAKGRLLAHATTTCLVFEIPRGT